jgi:hypothetical protein
MTASKFESRREVHIPYAGGPDGKGTEAEIDAVVFGVLEAVMAVEAEQLSAQATKKE